MRAFAIAVALSSGACSDEAGAPSGGSPTDAGGDGHANQDGHITDTGSDDVHEHRDGIALDAVDSGPFDGPTLLSETGLYADFASRTLAPDVMPYTVRFELWADGATKNRFFRLPPGGAIDTTNMEEWRFPVGTKAWKEFALDGKVIETRLMEKIGEGNEGWRPVAYVWRADGSEADATPLGQKDAAGTPHDVPSQDDCKRCHMGTSRDFLIGVSAIQLAGETGTGFLGELAGSGKLTAMPTADFDPPGTGIVHDVLGYFHGNCGHCHSDGYFLADKFKLRLRLVTTDATPEETATYRTAINGITGHVLEGTSVAVVPGDPAASQLYLRMGLRNFESMPPLATEQVDSIAHDRVRDWILSL